MHPLQAANEQTVTKPLFQWSADALVAARFAFLVLVCAVLSACRALVYPVDMVGQSTDFAFGGCVYAADTGEPMVGATVLLAAEGNLRSMADTLGHVKTDSQGCFTLSVPNVVLLPPVGVAPYLRVYPLGYRFLDLSPLAVDGRFREKLYVQKPGSGI